MQCLCLDPERKHDAAGDFTDLTVNLFWLYVERDKRPAMKFSFFLGNLILDTFRPELFSLATFNLTISALAGVFAVPLNTGSTENLDIR